MAKKKSRKKKIAEALLSVAGVAVVAGTFYVREVKREHTKELNAAIAEAQSQLNTREAIQNVLASVQLMESELATGTCLTGIDMMEASGLPQKQASIKTRLQWAHELLQAVENPGDLQQRLARLEEASENFSRDVAGIEKHVKKLETTIQPSEAPRDDSSGPPILIADHFNEFEGNYPSFKRDLDAEVKKEQDANKASLESYNRWSYYFLYPLGFLLSLAGKLFGIESADATE